MFDGIQDIGLFIVAGLVLNITPGPDTLLIVSRSSAGGWRSGAAAALGIGTGCFVHTLAAAIGISALIAASADAFTAIKWLGAAYLLYLGVRLLFLRSPDGCEPSRTQDASERSSFLQGLLTNVLNPKVALFFLAFLPQFVDPGASDKAIALVWLGLIFNVNGTLWNLLVAWLAARALRRFSGATVARRWFDRALGALFVALAARVAAARSA